MAKIDSASNKSLFFRFRSTLREGKYKDPFDNDQSLHRTIFKITAEKLSCY